MATKHKLAVADATKLPWKSKSVHLIITSPPYCDARTYGINAQRGCEEWISWQLLCLKEMVRVCKGPIIYNVGGVTRDNCYWPACEGLLYRAWQSGIECYRPIIWHKKGIPGKNKDWVRNDIEYVYCFKPPGPLPYSNVDAVKTKTTSKRFTFTNRRKDGVRPPTRDMKALPMSNPGNVFQWHFTDKELAVLLNWERLQMTEGEAKSAESPGTLLRIVAGSAMGHPMAHNHEAPFPEALVAWFLKGWAPPNGWVCDPFAGSGTVASVAQRLGVNSKSSDIRKKCIKMIRSRLESPWLANKYKSTSESGGLFD